MPFRADGMEMIQFSGMALVDCPGFTSIETCLEQTALYTFSFMLRRMPFLLNRVGPYTGRESSEGGTGFGDPCVYFIINDHASGQGAAVVCEPIHSIQSLAVDSDIFFVLMASPKLQQAAVNLPTLQSTPNSNPIIEGTVICE